MKKILVALMALAAVAPLTADILADFSEGKGRVETEALERFFVTPAEFSVVDDEGAPSGKALLAKLSARKEGVKIGRYNVLIKLTAEEAAKIREISFDVKVNAPKGFGWGMVYFQKPGVWVNCLRHPMPASTTFKPGEWRHLTFPASGFTPEGEGIARTEARRLLISFFVSGPVEISIANIAFAE